MIIETTEDTMPLCIVLKEAGLVCGRSLGVRLIYQGAVRIDGVKCDGSKAYYPVKTGETHTYEVGRNRKATVKLLKTLNDQNKKLEVIE